MDYMGGTDNAKRAWMLNFVAKLSADSGVYFVTSADVGAISASVDLFDEALTLVQTPDGRTKTNTANKNNLRAAAQSVCRQYARMIKYNMGISDEAKVAAGINPPNAVPAEAHECPTSAPGLTLIAATQGAQTLNYSNPMDPTARKKPLGADGIVLFVAVTDEPTTDIEQAKFYRKFTTSPMPVFFEPEQSGKVATYFARWIGQRGDMSTPSAPVSMRIAA